MDKQILLELEEYLQKNSKEILLDAVLDEENSYSLYRIEEEPHFTQEKPQKRVLNTCPPPKKEFVHKALFSQVGSTDQLSEYIRKSRTSDTFSTKLLDYIVQTGYSDADIYKKAGIDRRLFSKIRCDRNYRPKKATAMALCLALRLGLEQVEELLKLAGYSLSSSDTGDLIVKFCIEKGMYDLIEVNEMLDYFGEKALGLV